MRVAAVREAAGFGLAPTEPPEGELGGVWGWWGGTVGTEQE